MTDEMEKKAENTDDILSPPEDDVSPPVNAKWYVIHTYSGHEKKVKRNLEKQIEIRGWSDRIFDIVIPTRQITEMKDGQRTTSVKKSYPSYMLLNMIIDDEIWRMVNDTNGVTHFVGGRNKPQPLKEEEVRTILDQLAGVRSDDTKNIPFSIGDSVKVIDGPFSDFTGVAEEVNLEKRRVKVMVTVFGRATPVELDFLQVELL